MLYKGYDKYIRILGKSGKHMLLGGGMLLPNKWASKLKLNRRIKCGYIHDCDGIANGNSCDTYLCSVKHITHIFLLFRC